jgi:hypothetical protein
MAKQIAAEGLSVREVERRARDRAPKRRVGERARPIAESAQVHGIEDGLRRVLQTDVHVVDGPGGKGELRVSFYSPDDLDLERLLDLIAGPNRAWA